jgi:hypothetical protein
MGFEPEVKDLLPLFKLFFKLFSIRTVVGPNDFFFLFILRTIQNAKRREYKR